MKLREKTILNSVFVFRPTFKLFNQTNVYLINFTPFNIKLKNVINKFECHIAHRRQIQKQS